jgi:hypothetical protein
MLDTFYFYNLIFLVRNLLSKFLKIYSNPNYPNLKTHVL